VYAGIAMVAPALVAAATLLAVLLAAAYLSRRRRAAPPPPPPPAARAATATAPAGARRKVTAAELATHHTEHDVWLAIDGKVYDFSSYIDLHPGGLALLNNAGGDATAGFHGEQHPLRVNDLVRGAPPMEGKRAEGARPLGGRGDDPGGGDL